MENSGSFEKECKKSKFYSMILSLFDFKRTLHGLETHQIEELYSADIYIQMWKITSDHLQAVFKTLEISISKFWGICKKFILTKNTKVSFWECSDLRNRVIKMQKILINDLDNLRSSCLTPSS